MASVCAAGSSLKAVRRKERVKKCGGVSVYHGSDVYRVKCKCKEVWYLRIFRNWQKFRF